MALYEKRFILWPHDIDGQINRCEGDCLEGDSPKTSSLGRTLRQETAALALHSCFAVDNIITVAGVTMTTDVINSCSLISYLEVP